MEKLVGFLSYKDKFNRYHVTNLSHYNNEKWNPSVKDHYNMNAIEKKYTNKLLARENDSNFQIVNPFEQNGFYFTLDKKCIFEKFYKVGKLDIDPEIAISTVTQSSKPKDIIDFIPCKIEDLLGQVVVINAKMQLYTSDKLKKVGCKINALHIKNLEL